MAFPRNIFQDVMHKDRLVKSFIDEVSLRDSLLTPFLLSFIITSSALALITCMCLHLCRSLGVSVETRSVSAECVFVPLPSLAAQEGPDTAQIY